MVAMSWMVLLLLLLIVVPLACLFSRRMRPVGLVILGLLACGVFGLFFVRVSHRPSNVIFPQHQEVYRANNVLIDSLPGLTELDRAEEQAEVLRNQRMAAQMDDAFVQKSPDGSTLETYPDGMQIRQRWPDGFRSIVRTTTGDGGQWVSSHSTRSKVRFILLGAPLLALLVAFWALKRSKQTGGIGVGPALVMAGVTAMLVFGFIFQGSSRHVVEGNAIAVANAPLPHGQISSESQAELARVQQDLSKVFEEVYSQQNDAVPQQSIESIWMKLTQPRINLDPVASPEAKATQRELANAARVILSASAPGADPFTQGWLMNAAKAIMNSSPKGEAPAVKGEMALVTPPQVAPGTPAAPLKAGAVTVKQTTDKPRPEWIDNPPKLAGDTRRVVVSTDPLKTTEECHAQLEKRLRYAVADRLRQLAKQATGRSAVNSPMLADMGISPDFILRELCPEGAHVETVNGSAGELKRAHALIDFTPQKDEILLQRWQLATSTPIAQPVAAEAPPRANSYTTGERPEWLDKPPKLVGNTRRVVVSTDPYSTVEECHAALRDKLRGVVQARVDELARAANGGHYTRAPGLDSMGINIEYILSELCPEDDYIETVNASFGEMKRAHALVEFNEPQDRLLLDRWRAFARVQSIEIVAGLAAFVVAGLAFVYGLLKVDTWTRGYYTKRLFLGVPAAIIAVFFITALFGF